MTRGIHGAISKTINVEAGDYAASSINTADVATESITNTKLAANIKNPVMGVALGYKIARGLYSVTTAAAATIPTGLTTVVSILGLTPYGTSSATIANSCSLINGVISGTNLIVRRWRTKSAATTTMVSATSTGGIYWGAIGT